MARDMKSIPPLRQAALIALTQVLDVLAPYSDHFVLIGGWAPYLLLSRYGHTEADHIGSADLDLCFNGPGLTPAIRDEIVAALAKIGCQQRMWDDVNGVVMPDTYLLPVRAGGHVVKVQIDLIGLDRVGKRKLESQYALALKRAENISFRIGNRNVQVPVSGAAAVFAMKAIALNNRHAAKDAYDLYMVTRYYKNGPESLAAELRPLLIGPPMRLAVSNVARWFKDERAPGPRAVAQFLLPDAAADEQQQLSQEAFLMVKVLLDEIDS
ncbi:MAG: nucleotidyl transferase AbiEii/AbiGii toxin family protein [Anaerolineae bacterium]|nr:nucleotidyl transferase AbiEii/AbiGii toxin family protein [Anaerolineae bacterium]